MSRRAARAAQPVVPGRRAAVARLRQLAGEAARTGAVAEGPPHPDAALLRACGQVAFRLQLLHRLRHETGEHAASAQPLTRAEMDTVCAEAAVHTEQMRSGLREASALPAVTGAGLYGKALLCARQDVTGTAALGRSLARDLLAIPALRSLLWPAADGDAP